MAEKWTQFLYGPYVTLVAWFKNEIFYTSSVQIHCKPGQQSSSTVENQRRNTSIWVLTSFVFLTSFRFMSSFAFLNFFVGLTSLDFELFWCLMLFVLFCCLTSLVLYTLSKKCVRLLTFFYRNFFVPFYFCFQVHSVFMFCVFMELFQILLWHHFRTLILIGRTP